MILNIQSMILKDPGLENLDARESFFNIKIASHSFAMTFINNSLLNATWYKM